MTKIEHNQYQQMPDLRFLLITVLLVALLALALFIQTMVVFKPRYEELRSDQNSLQTDIERLGWEIAEIKEGISD